MSFFEDWNEEKYKYITLFLRKDISSVNALNCGTENEMDVAFKLLTEISIESMLDVVLKMDLNRELTSADIPQFSNFKNGAERVSEILEFYKEGLSFEELGYQLGATANSTAEIKYGENHAKLAVILGLATMEKDSRYIVKSTSWGRYLLRYRYKEKIEVFKRMILREPMIQIMIRKAYHGKCNYRDIVNFLTDSTAQRRKSNVKLLLEFALVNSEAEKILENIEW